MKPLGQDMLQKSAHEFQCRQAHGLPFPGVGILVAERHVIVFQGNDAVVGDGNPVDIAGEIRQYLFRLLEGWPGEDDPVLVPDLLGEVLLGQCLPCVLHKDGAEDRRERPDRHEEPTAGRSPDPVFIKGAARNEKMEMGMEFLGPGPGMEDGQLAKLAAEVFAVKAELGQGRDRRLKEDGIERFLVAAHDFPE